MRFDLTIDEPIPPTASALAQRRLFIGILVSLVLHAIVLSLKLGVPGLDFPDFELPWKKKRVGVINESLQVQIAGTAPRVPPVIAPPPAPSVTTSELFKLPDPILPTPVAKTSPEQGILVLPPLPKLAQSLNVSDKKSGKSPRIKKDLPTPILRVPPPSDPSPRVIAQDQSVNSEFLIKQSEKDEREIQRDANKLATENKDPIPVDAVIDKDAEQQSIDEKNRQELAKKAESAEKKAQEELQQKQRDKEIAEAQKKQIESALASQTNQVGQTMPALADSMSDELKKQRQAAAKQARAALQKREQEQALEEAAQEARRQELLTQETLKQDELRRQAEQQRQQQLAQEQEKQRQQQAQIQKKQQEEQQKQLALAEQQRQEEMRNQKLLAQQLLEQKLAEQKLAEQKLAEQKLAEQKLAEQKLAEQKLAEQKLAEQKLAEQKLAEQKLAEQKLAEQKLAEQKLAEQKLAEQKLAEQKLAEQKLAEQKLAEQKLAEQKLAQQRADTLAKQAAQANQVQGNGNGTVGIGATRPAPIPLTGGDLASRLREQARRGDVYKDSAPSLGTANDSKARRRSFLGAYDKEVPLRMYVDGIKQKLERNGNLIYERRTLSDVEHQVLINMVVRSDGSIEEVMILRSSGSRAIDERAKNIAITNAPFAVFPPALAAKYDVIEVQRLWVFGDRMRILENLPGSF